MINTIQRYLRLFQKSERLQLLFLTIISTGIFSYQIGRESLWLDEIYTYYASNTWDNLVATITWKEKNMWLYHILMYVWKFLGPGEIIMRSLSVVFAVLAVISLYKLGKEIKGKLLGFIAALLLSLNTHFLYYAQEARGYSLFALLFVLSSLYLIKYIKTRRQRYRNLYILCVAASFFTHLYTLFFIPIQALLLLWNSRTGKQFFSWMFTYFMVAVSMSPIILAYIIANAGKVVTKSKGALSWIPLPGSDTVYKFYLAYSSTSNLFLFISFCLLLFLIFNYFYYRSTFLRNNTSLLIYFVAVAFVPMVFLYSFSLFVKPLFVMRYLLFALPAYIMILGLALVSIKNKKILFFLVFITVGLHLNMLRFYHGYYRKEQWKQAVEYIHLHYKPGDTIVVFPESTLLPVTYYNDANQYDLPANNIVVAFPKDLTKVTPEEIKTDITALNNNIATSPGVWVIARAENLPVSRATKKEAIEEMLANNYKKELTVDDYKNLKIQYFSERR